jgi:hypothetical protein
LLGKRCPLLHLRRSLCGAGHTPVRGEFVYNCRIISFGDFASSLVEDRECAVRQVFERYGVIVQEGVGSARGLNFVHGREGQRGEREDAEPTSLRGTSDPCDRRIDSEATRVRYLAGNETERALANTEQGRIRGHVRGANELRQHHAGVVGKFERGAVDEGDADRAVGSGLDRVVLADRVTDFDVSDNTAVARDGDLADRRLDLADRLERRSRHRLSETPNNTITWRIAGATKHVTPPGLWAASRRVASPFSD